MCYCPAQVMLQQKAAHRKRFFTIWIVGGNYKNILISRKRRPHSSREDCMFSVEKGPWLAAEVSGPWENMHVKFSNYYLQAFLDTKTILILWQINFKSNNFSCNSSKFLKYSSPLIII